MATLRDRMTAVRTEALFVSSIPTGGSPSRGEVTAAIKAALRSRHGSRGCAAEMGAAYGDCPESTVMRIRWARAVVQSIY